MAKQATEYVLVHGAAHGAWCWIISRALASVTPQPLRPLTEPVDLRVFYRLRIPCTYVRCLRDVAVPPAKVAEYAGRLGVTPVDLDSAHDPMLSAPDELTRILERI